MRGFALFAVLLIAGGSDDPARIERLAQSNVVAGETICMASPLRTFYRRRRWQPAWSDTNLAALMRSIDGAESHGLDPQRFHRHAIVELGDPIERDVLASDAFLRLASNLSHGAVDPEFLRAAWCAEPKIDLAAVLQSALDNGNVDATLEHLAPDDPRYGRLREELRRLRGAKWAAIAAGKKLRAGDRDPRVIALRMRVEGENAGTSEGADADLFDAALDAKVRELQSHHGVAADGVIGRDTLRELNVSPEERAEQIAANLERWRWMPRSLGDTYVIVNIAGFQLDVFDRGRSAMTMKTVVGKQYHETPFFAALITDVTINPWWNVPDSIANHEIWPKQRRDPGYFAREHMIVANDGRIRQRPGEWNSLGRIKFEMPNRYDVYLHDTPSKSLFDATVRAFSHGCIRIERPLDLAHFLLRDQARWNGGAIENAIVAGDNQRVAITAPVPVYVLYWTAWPANDGDVEYHRDVYGNDARVIAALR